MFHPYRKPTAGVPVSPVLRNYDGFCCATHCILMNISPEIPGCLSNTVTASSVYSSISPSSLREEEGVTRSRIFGATRASALYLRHHARDDSREVAADEVTDNANIVSSQPVKVNSHQPSSRELFTDPVLSDDKFYSEHHNIPGYHSITGALV